MITLSTEMLKRRSQCLAIFAPSRPSPSVTSLPLTLPPFWVSKSPKLWEIHCPALNAPRGKRWDARVPYIPFCRNRMPESGVGPEEFPGVGILW